MSAVAYLVKGSEPSLRDGVVHDLVAELLGADDRSLALEEITIPGRPERPERPERPGPAGGGDEGDSATAGGAEGREVAVAALLNAASSPPFMTEHRIVVVHDTGALTAADVGGIVRYLDDPLDTTILVFVAGGGTMAPALTKKLKEIRAEERAPKSEDTPKVLISTAHEGGVLLKADTAELISKHLGANAGRVASLIDVLGVAYAPGTTLTVDDVTPYLGEGGAVPPYLLSNAIEAGDPPGALEVLHKLMTLTSPQQPKPMHPLQIIAVLAGYYRRILRLDDASLRSPADAIEALGGKVKEFPARKALEQARALGADGIRQAFDALFQADLDIKGARGIPETAVMEVLVVRLTRLAARSGGRRRR